MDSSKIKENWSEACARVKGYEGIDPSQINAFFSRLEPQAMSEGFLMLTADNDFIKTWIERHYVEVIKRALSEMYQVPFTVVIEVDTTATAQPAAQEPAPAATAQAPVQTHSTATPALAPGQPAVSAGAPTTAHPLPGAPALTALTPAVTPTSSASARAAATLAPYPDHYIDQRAAQQKAAARRGGCEGPTSTLTFENFVIGDSNRMAYSMAVGVAEMPGKTPLNPLFIYGKSGLGKTHLMRAIQNYICETQPYLRTVYVDSAELLSDYMEASAAHDKEKSSYKNFKTHYEEADVLLIDDIQYLQGKKQTLDIVFQIFNKLTTQGRQIVLSADRAPKNIDIDERYHSRFNQGGTIDIQPPEIETKLGIVKSFIKEYADNEGLDHFTIPEDIQMYIAENSSSNIRELKSAVTKVIYQITFFNQPDLTIEGVRTLLENHFSGGTSKNLTVEDIQREVEGFFKVKHSDLIGPKRARNIVYPRQIAIYLCRQLLDLPFNDIGKKFNRDHSTAMHSVTTVEELMRGSREVQEEIETLKQIIREL
ncbi:MULTISPECIES: chromosomal replication initiator protein DnaA [unclassified Adlercreutzia]|uniref:chromosomal replication initiator protein DnaA n=1 Tax=unclassified Adlercreutzia TaxID=2636013 RepID=UPI0013E99FCB|nr:MULTISPECIES: chromosomal replication initiator protein DnaA [unclassified Adlercreutzia]